MPKAGDVIENPIMTDRIIFRKTQRDTNGELLQFDNYHKPGGIGPILRRFFGYPVCYPYK